MHSSNFEKLFTSIDYTLLSLVSRTNETYDNFVRNTDVLRFVELMTFHAVPEEKNPIYSTKYCNKKLLIQMTSQRKFTFLHKKTGRMNE